MVILIMGLEVIREFADPSGQQCNLHLGGSGVAVLALKIFDDFLFRFGGDQPTYPFFRLALDFALTVFGVMRNVVCSTRFD